MSRRLSKKPRATKLATNVAFSAANLPKLDSSVLDALFARSPAPKRSLRASLLVGSALTAGLLATSLVDVSPALAACSGAGTVTCTGNFPTPTGLPNFTGNTTVNLNTAIVGGNTTNVGDGVVLNATAFGQTLTTNVDGTSTIGVGANYTVAGDGIHMYSGFTGTTLSVSNAGAITAGGNGIYTWINDSGETANDKITISNSNQLYAGADGIHAVIDARVPDTFNATNSITITNTGAIGSKTKYAGGYGIYSKIAKTGYAPKIIGNPASITGINNVNNSKNMYTVGTSQYVGTFITDVAKGGGYATSGITNSGNLTSKTGSGLDARAYGATGSGGGGGGSATGTVVISNTGTLKALGAGYGIRGYAKANTNYNLASTNATLSGGHATATTSITNGGNVTTGNATTFGNEGIAGRAYAYTGVVNKGAGNKSTADGGTSIAGVTITNGNSTVTPAVATFGDQSAIGGTAQALAGALGFIGQGGSANSTTSIYNSGALSITPIKGNSTDPTLYGVGIAEADGVGDAGKGGSGAGGSANATVTLSNTGGITSSGDPGIYGYANASATGGFFDSPVSWVLSPYVL